MEKVKAMAPHSPSIGALLREVARLHVQLQRSCVTYCGGTTTTPGAQHEMVRTSLELLHQAVLTLTNEAAAQAVPGEGGTIC
jgi:hypothetical protein